MHGSAALQKILLLKVILSEIAFDQLTKNANFIIKVFIKYTKRERVMVVFVRFSFLACVGFVSFF